MVKSRFSNLILLAAQKSISKPSNRCPIFIKRHYIPSTVVPDTHVRSFGQPTYLTHPNIIKKGEVTPGFNSDEFETRRSTLMKSLPKDSVVVLMGNRIRYMSNNIFYPFHQNTDLWYLCGFNEPDAAMILGNHHLLPGYPDTDYRKEKNESDRGYKQTMFVLPKSAHAELWDGPRTGTEGVLEFFGADEAFDTSKFQSFFNNLVSSSKRIFMELPDSMPTLLNATPTDLSPARFSPLSHLIQELRIIKSPNELNAMKTSGKISSQAFIEAMKWTKPGITENQLWAKFEFENRLRGATKLAYVPVIAGGPNALSMHYVRNDMPLKDGDLVLVDCGGEFNGYASDITRTWPVNGKFTEPQKELYQAVLNVNKACINLCTELSSISLHGIHSQSMKLMKHELQRIGFPVNNWDLERILYPHHIGHYLGLDVHDLHHLDRYRKLKKNMAVTIEPGIYIPFDNRFPKKYQGIGIRIEDNVVVGSNEPYVLSSTSPKEVVDIEFCCNH